MSWEVIGWLALVVALGFGAWYSLEGPDDEDDDDYTGMNLT